MRNASGRIIFAACLLWSAGIACAAPVDVPPELEAWRQWALDQQQFRRCPFLAGTNAQQADSFVCAWPERLSLDVTAPGGRFSQRWQVHADSWIALPGDMEHWPRDVRLNGTSAAVVAFNNSPHLHLTPGSYTIAGEFRWTRRPESLSVAEQTALIDLTVDGQRIAQPERPQGVVWLGKRRTAQQQEQMAIQVYRRVEDQIPVRLTTLIRLQVAGDGREELLARVLPEGFVPLSMQSMLPARIEPDGRLRVQVRAGSWDITIAARGTKVAEALRRPKVEGPWAREEVWSFAGDDRLRVVAIEGVGGVDPVQTGVPEGWRELPSYGIAEDSELRVVERSRGISAADENQPRLRRTLWFDFDHDGYTAVDDINGTMRQGWRLDMAAPQELLSATADGENLLVTKGASEGLTGIELREPDLQLRTVSRIEKRGSMSATGWQGRFVEVAGTLNVPPGHRLLAAIGADDAPSSWIERWRLLDMFLVLIASAAVARLIGWRAGVLALLALTLTYHDAGAQAWFWINLLIAVVLAREAPEGRLRRVAVLYRNASAIVLALLLVPFVFEQVRLAIYPQLEVADYGLASRWVRGRMAGEGAEQTDAVEADKRAAPEAAPPAAPPAMEAPESQFREAESSMDRGTTTVTASRLRPQDIQGAASYLLQRYAPGTLVQTGPGIPNWNYNSYSYSWSGPVDAAQSVRFLVLTPFWLGLWRILGCLLLAALLVLIAHLSLGRPQLPAWARRLSSTLPLLLLALLPLHDPRAETPDAAILQELKTRLTRAPECAPSCADVMHARVRAQGDRLEIELEVSALTAVAVPIPAAVNEWEPESTSIDGQANGGVYRDRSDTRWIALRPGAHSVTLSGRVADDDSVQVVFPMRPRTIEVSAEGWEFSGTGDGRLLTNTLELVRKRSGAGASRLEAGREFPPFVHVHRHLMLDLDWTMGTAVRRVAPEKGAFTMAVPLLPTESVLTEGVEVRDDRTALVAMAAGESVVSWNSGLPRAETLVLEFPDGAPRSELWSFAVSPQWNVSFNGTPAVFPADPDAGQWVFEFHPRAGEKLTLAISRPAAAKGATLAIDNVRNLVQVGKRSTRGSLELQYRSTQGGRHTIALPADARVSAVLVDGRSTAVRPDKGDLTLGLLPGAHNFKIDWQSDNGVRPYTSTPGVELRAPASNVTTQLNVPEDRWVLFAHGPGVGPAILFWSELAVFVVLAFLIGSSRYSPLRTHEWLLVGLGLSTFSWGVLLLFAVWMFAMRWRESWSGEVSRARFNFRQVALALLSIIALVGLVAAIPSGLLGTPDMRVAGPGSHPGSFLWFLDGTDDVLPQPGVISISLWWYRAAMLAWALWLSFALLRWVPWAWRAWSRDGFWRGHVIAAASAK